MNAVHEIDQSLNAYARRNEGNCPVMFFRRHLSSREKMERRQGKFLASAEVRPEEIHPATEACDKFLQYLAQHKSHDGLNFLWWWRLDGHAGQPFAHERQQNVQFSKWDQVIGEGYAALQAVQTMALDEQERPMLKAITKALLVIFSRNETDLAERLLSHLNPGRLNRTGLVAVLHVTKPHSSGHPGLARICIMIEKVLTERGV